MSRMLLILLLVGLVIVAAPGCVPRAERGSESLFPIDESEFVLMLMIDPRVIAEGAAGRGRQGHELMMRAVDEYFQARIGGNDKIILAQITGNKHSILWEGTPRALREEFATPEELDQFLQSQVKQQGDFLAHDAIAYGLKYLMRRRSVATGQAMSVMMVLSTMEDTSEDPAAEQRFMDECIKFLEMGGGIGFYFLSQEKYFPLCESFEKAGYPMVPIEADVHGRPGLPNFDL